MFWWLLLLYPLTSAVVATYCVHMYRKYDPQEDVRDYLVAVFIMIFLWPIYIWVVIPELWDAKKEFLSKTDKEYEKLLEQLRRERLLPDPLLADWDREFNALQGIEEPKKSGWEDYLNHDWDVIEDKQLCDAPLIEKPKRGYSRGGRIMVPNEPILFDYYGDELEFRVRDLGSHFTL